jgi:hypothetical protein
VAADVADAIGSFWESENIPDLDLLYMRVHHFLLDKDGTPMPGAFRDHGKGMSTDWNKYSLPEDTLARAKIPSDNAVISMGVGDVRSIPGQVVLHTPCSQNRAHSDVIGDKKTNAEVRIKFTRIYKIVIPYAG